MDHKANGNKAFQEGRYEDAVESFTKAIEESPNHVLYSNRSAAYASLKKFEMAMADAEQVVKLSPTWAKGYSRLGAALHGLDKIKEAREAYEKGLEIDPNNEPLKSALKELPTGTLFGEILNESIWGKMAVHPNLKDYLNDQGLCAQISMAIQNPQMAMNLLTQNPKIMTIIMTLMGVEMPEEKMDVEPEPEPEPMQVEETNVEQLKKQGNEAYRKRDFDAALALYDEAFLASEKQEPTLLTNKASVYFEKGDYLRCIEICDEAIELGKSLRFPFEFFGKALARQGNAYYKLGDLENAISKYKNSLTESRTKQVLEKLNEVEREKAKRDKEAYRNPELSEEARLRGNNLFTKGKYAEAVKEYTESIKRNDTDARVYSNRSACYHKLGALPESMKDIDKCLELDPTFVKAYIRKGYVYLLKKSTSEALKACDQASKADVERRFFNEIQELKQKVQNAINDRANKLHNSDEKSREEALKQALQDPEVAQIMSDPAMNQILQQMQSDPRAARDLLQDPVIADKINKLVAAGIVATR